MPCLKKEEDFIQNPVNTPKHKEKKINYTRTIYACDRKGWKIYHEFYAIINRMMYEQYKKNFTNLMTKEKELCKTIIGQHEIIMIQLKNGNISDIHYFCLGLSY